MRTPRGLIIDQEGREVRPRTPLAGGNDWHGGESFMLLLHRLFETFGLHGGQPTRAQRIARIEAVAMLLDVAFVVPGTKMRYGLEGVVGLVPVIGDVVTKVISLWIVREARALGAPWHVTTRMLGNVALDGAVGLVPFAGDAFDIFYKANMRNIRLLQRWLERHP